MHSEIIFSANLISPCDFDLIDSVFRAELRKRRLSRRSEEAERLAARLISLYQEGRRDANELTAAVADARTNGISIGSSAQ
ncbi:hypothetical protein CN188_27175 [Sinorhizobium meliloti]|nr:hypothetical protein [Sinorhizobium meliloti]RVI75128.1 hypothetical protein CN188_27175 [Sinorhizobium meliloti]RVI98644.1 hypothetical protein CN193_23105 [Sinorhizobium meliloti]